MTQTNQTPHEQAQSRVNRNTQLKAHESTIMYDWPEGDTHWNRVATAPVKEIVDWAETVEQQ